MALHEEALAWCKPPGWKKTIEEYLCIMRHKLSAVRRRSESYSSVPRYQRTGSSRYISQMVNGVILRHNTTNCHLLHIGPGEPSTMTRIASTDHAQTPVDQFNSVKILELSVIPHWRPMFRFRKLSTRPTREPCWLAEIFWILYRTYVEMHSPP